VGSGTTLHSLSAKRGEIIKGVVHFKKKTFADNLLNPCQPRYPCHFFLFKVFDENIAGFFSI